LTPVLLRPRASSVPSISILQRGAASGLIRPSQISRAGLLIHTFGSVLPRPSSSVHARGTSPTPSALSFRVGPRRAPSILFSPAGCLTHSALTLRVGCPLRSFGSILPRGLRSAPSVQDPRAGHLTHSFGPIPSRGLRRAPSILLSRVRWRRAMAQQEAPGEVFRLEEKDGGRQTIPRGAGARASTGQPQLTSTVRGPSSPTPPPCPPLSIPLLPPFFPSPSPPLEAQAGPSSSVDWPAPAQPGPQVLCPSGIPRCTADTCFQPLLFLAFHWCLACSQLKPFSRNEISWNLLKLHLRSSSFAVTILIATLVLTPLPGATRSFHADLRRTVSLDDPAFVKYLKYLQYWANPPYVQFIK